MDQHLAIARHDEQGEKRQQAGQRRAEMVFRPIQQPGPEDGMRHAAAPDVFFGDAFHSQQREIGGAARAQVADIEKTPHPHLGRCL